MNTYLADPQFKTQLEQLNQALTELRFAEGLRRNSDAARAETNLHFAFDLGFVNGIYIELNRLREISLLPTESRDLTPSEKENSGTPKLTVEEKRVRDYWQMQLWVSQHWAQLNPPKNGRGGLLNIGTRPQATQPRQLPLPQTLATMQKLACVSLPHAQMAIPQSQHLELFQNLFETNGIPGILKAGLLVAQSQLAPIFTQENQTVTLTFVRNYLVESGVEPTGCLQFMAGIRANQVAYTQALQNLTQAGANPELLGNWLRLWVKILADSVAPSQQLIRHLQAGKLPECTNL
ncbi:hypothetical protein HMPREF0044_0269 [Gleimia coleocanis DSM 15436]|uniref:Fido domain-containing protein n=1 Tax=Gleimia coleocanis DSM 15436 TaxID=525245 RepID=C0VYM9_9ACTO|nr:hypothetical protein [Gleimia coleocanis]EEH64532.1 hypothetical protein HMPREF0044_0269 [Gleimia coleocanis DSM 15436]